MRLSNLQTVSGKDWSGMTSKNHLGSIWQQNPQVASKLISRMLAKSYGTTLDTLLDSIPVKTLDTDDDFTWSLMGSSEQNVPLVEARFQGSVVSETDINVGEGKQRFELVFPKRWFSPTELLLRLSHDHKLQFPLSSKNPLTEGTKNCPKSKLSPAVANYH